MAECKVYGRVIAVSKEQVVASAQAGREPFRKREIYIDCTRYDPYTGTRSEYENKPLLEFNGDKTLAKVNPVLDSLQKDDVVAISFDLQGRKITNQQGQNKFFTAIRCYAIEVVRKAGQQAAAPAPAPAVQTPAQQQVQQPAPAAAPPQAANPFPPAPTTQQLVDQQGNWDDDLPF